MPHARYQIYVVSQISDALQGQADSMNARSIPELCSRLATHRSVLLRSESHPDVEEASLPLWLAAYVWQQVPVLLVGYNYVVAVREIPAAHRFYNQANCHDPCHNDGAWGLVRVWQQPQVLLLSYSYMTALCQVPAAQRAWDQSQA